MSYSGIKEGLFTPEHRQRMGEAVWLFGWLLSKQTSESGGIGPVWGGKPMTYGELAGHTGWPPATIRKWAERLRQHGYIQTKRTPQGLRWYVLKAKKFTKRTPKSGQSKSGHSQKSDSPDMDRRSPRYGQAIAHPRTITQNQPRGKSGLTPAGILITQETIKNTRKAATPPTSVERVRVQRAVLDLKAEMNPKTWHTFVRSIEAHARNGQLILSTDSRVSREYLQTDGQTIWAALQAKIGEPIKLTVR